MSRELIKFNKEIDNFARMIPDKAILMQKKIVLEALRRLVMKTPVDTGHARMNWQVTIGKPANGEIEGYDKEGKKTIARGLAAIKDLSAYKVVWISNNVTYIEFLEDGSSKQAPEGMLAVTVEELRMMFKKAV
jgi:hypothetical protein